MSASYSQPRKDFLIPLLAVVSDAVMIEASFLFSYWLRFYSPFAAYIPVTKGFPDLSSYVEGSFVVIPAWLLLFNSRGMYGSRRIIYFSDEFFAIIRLVFFGLLMVMAGAFFYRAFSYSRLVFGLLGVSSVVFISLGRFIVLNFEHRWYSRGKDLRRVIVVGTNDAAAKVYATLSGHRSLGYELLGYFGASRRGPVSASGARYLGSIRKVPGSIREMGVDLVLVALNSSDHPLLFELVRQCEGLNAEMMMVPDTLEIMTSGVRLKEVEGIPFLRIKTIPLSTWNLILKRAFDLAFSSVTLLLSAPLFALIAIAIKLDSEGGVFYRQERVGLDGKSFPVFKFRTMRQGAERRTGPVWASRDDPRVTRVGRFLRRFSMDELPQFFNVLRGEMSVVGPRPERPHFVERFKKDVPKYLERHRVKTGMTGWAQVNGLRGNTPIGERTRYDVYYVENWSLIFDLKIILKTLRAVLFGRDAY